MDKWAVPKAVLYVGDILWLLSLLGFVHEPLFNGFDFLQAYFSYFIILAFAIIAVLSLWVGSQITDWWASEEAKWHLTSDIQPLPFGTHDIVGSDKASKLTVRRKGKVLKLKGKMKHLKPLYMYDIQLFTPYVPKVKTWSQTTQGTIIGEGTAPRALCPTDKKGNGDWDYSLDVERFTSHHGIKDEFVVWFNDTDETHASVLASDPIPMHL